LFLFFNPPLAIVSFTEKSPRPILILPPFLNSTLNDQLWNGTAAKNRKIFNGVFRTTPTDEVRSWADYHKFIPDGIPAGHVADRSLSVQQLKEKLNQIKGHLVEMPLQFLIGTLPLPPIRCFIAVPIVLDLS
jgi:hypothetical protein